MLSVPITVRNVERYVSSQLGRHVRVAYVGNTRAPNIADNQNIAELLARERTNEIFVQSVPQ